MIGHIISRSVNGEPIPGLKVILNKEKIAETNEDGVFMFEGVKTGTHYIQVKAGTHFFKYFYFYVTDKKKLRGDRLNMFHRYVK